MDWAVAGNGCHVFRPVLDAPGLAAASMGAFRRHAGRLAPWHFRVLDERLLERFCGCDRRSSCARCAAENSTSLPRTGRPLDGRGLGDSCQQSALRGDGSQSTVAVAMLIWLMGPQRPRLSVALGHLVVPLVLTLTLAAAGTGYYNYRVTGNPLLMPYMVNHRIYGQAPLFLWQKSLAPPPYHHAVMREFYEHDLGIYRYERTFNGFLWTCLDRAWMMWGFYLGPALSIPLLAFPCIVRDRRMRFPLVAGAVLVLGLAFETWMLPHYAAPALGLLYLGLLQCMRHLRHWRWRGKPVGSALVRMVPLILCTMIILRLTAILAHVQIEPAWPPGNVARAQIVRALHNAPGQHLILVRYGKTHVPDNEWVYNAADIDNAKVVWARDMGEHDNKELVQYFKNRKVWIVEPDAWPVRLEPSPSYSAPTTR